VSQLERAIRNSWEVKSMPGKRAALHLERVFSSEECQLISFGYIPQAMEDHWFIYLEDGWLYLHRSWTGFCIYQVRLEAIGESHKIAEAWVNRDREQYVNKRDSYDRTLLSYLIDRVLLGRETAFPGDALLRESRRKWWQLWNRY